MKIHARHFFITLFSCSMLTKGSSQQQPDSVQLLHEVVVTAMPGSTLWKDVPASIAVVGKNELQRNATPTLLPVLNTIPGIRMEERSPGSYRLSIRGSLLRSPFGIRNIKVYYNGLPLSDASGNTYLNLLNIDQVSGAEVLKGPAASLYGAGTGGAVLLWSDTGYQPIRKQEYHAGIQGGSYGLFHQQAGMRSAGPNGSFSIQQYHLQSDGYRQRSAMRRDGLQVSGNYRKGKHETNVLGFYTDLHYQTPGGLTEAQMLQDPSAARPAAGAIPGAVQQQAGIYNKTFYAGVRYRYTINPQHNISSFVMGANTNFRNPFITNYEVRNEMNGGAGITWSWQYVKAQHKWQLHVGGEWLQQWASIDNYGNRNGQKDTVQYMDKVRSRQLTGFAQLSWQAGDRFIAQAGFSINEQLYRYERLTEPPVQWREKRIGMVLAPRLSLSYKATQMVTLYALVARGFSAPTLAEFRPSDGNFYPALNAETGWNVEGGVKGYLMQGRIRFNLAAYHFALRNAIVRRNDAQGNEYFVNAGGTKQPGAELMVRTKLLNARGKWGPVLEYWTSVTYQPYQFSNYTQGSTNLSGNRVTGVPISNWVNGIDLYTANGLYLNLQLNHTGKLYLNDANDAFAPSSQLLQGRAGFRRGVVDLYLALDNGLNQVYSLGHDINAVGRRYYNPAMPRNWAVGAFFRFN